MIIAVTYDIMMLLGIVLIVLGVRQVVPYFKELVASNGDMDTVIIVTKRHTEKTLQAKISFVLIPVLLLVCY